MQGGVGYRSSSKMKAKNTPWDLTTRRSSKTVSNDVTKSSCIRVRTQNILTLPKIQNEKVDLVRTR